MGNDLLYEADTFRFISTNRLTGKNGLTRASLRSATTDEDKTLKYENSDLKRAVAELTLEIMKYKKSLGM